MRDAISRDSVIAEAPPATDGPPATDIRGRRGGLVTRYVAQPLNICLLPAMALIAMILWVIWTRTGQVPYWDEWETVLFLQHAHQGTLSLDELWGMHGGAHRIFLPRIFDLTIVQLTQYNRQVEMTFDLAISMAGAGLLFATLRRTVQRKRLALALAIPLGLLYFSLGQYANWFAPFQLAFTLAVFGFLLALWAASGGSDTLSWGRFALTLLGAVIASLSAFQGLMVWIALLPSVLYLARRDRRKQILWLGAAIETWAVYLAGSLHAGFGGVRLVDFVTYATAYLGAPLGYPSATLAEVFGVLGLVLVPVHIALYFMLGGKPQRILPWIDAALFVLVCVFATLAGRVAAGVSSAMSSRYQVFSAIWWIALIVSGGLVVEALTRNAARHEGAPSGAGRRAALLMEARRRLGAHRRGLRLGYAALLTLFCGCLVAVNVAGLHDALLWQDVQRENQHYVVHYETAPTSCLTLYYPDVAVVDPLIAYLQRNRMAVFSRDSAQSGSQLAADAASQEVGCTKPYHFIDDVRGSYPVMFVAFHPVNVPAPR